MFSRVPRASRAPRAGGTLFHDPHKARPLTLLTAPRAYGCGPLRATRPLYGTPRAPPSRPPQPSPPEPSIGRPNVPPNPPPPRIRYLHVPVRTFASSYTNVRACKTKRGEDGVFSVCVRQVQRCTARTNPCVRIRVRCRDFMKITRR